MNKENIAIFQNKGFVLIKSLIPKEVLIKIEEWYTSENFDSSSYETVSEKNSEVMRKARRLFWNNSDFWKEIIRESKIEQLIKESLKNPVLIHHAMFSKSSGGEKVGNHQDQFLWDYDYPNSINLWFSLDPTNKKNGCIYVYPNSNQCGLIDHTDHDGFHNCISKSKINELELGDLEYIEMNKGDVLLWDRHTVHGSEKNSSQTKRRGIVMVFVEENNIETNTIDRYKI